MTSFTGLATRILTAVILIAALGGCVAEKYAGEGPLQLSPSVSDLFSDYQKRSWPVYFLVTEDGRCAEYSYCPKSSVACEQSSFFKGFDRCESDCSAPCKTLASHGTIAWKGPVTDANGKLLNP